MEVFLYLVSWDFFFLGKMLGSFIGVVRRGLRIYIYFVYGGFENYWRIERFVEKLFCSKFLIIE